MVQVLGQLGKALGKTFCDKGRLGFGKRLESGKVFGTEDAELEGGQVG